LVKIAEYPFFIPKTITKVKIMENSNVKMLREISNDRITPKKSDKMESSKDFYERLVDNDDLFCNEVESYEVITEYR
jgi:hypothetical protein